MGIPPNPAPSPFVCGTTDPSHVYMIDSGTRRLIPDDQTLKFLLADQTVRVLSDADLAAIPAGAPLPSRRDGQIVSQDFGHPVPGALIYYFMANGFRRFITDIETVVGFQKAGAQFVAIKQPDFGAIPQGANLPTRKDGTAYAGSGAFAFVMESGLKRSVPDATTFRAAGHDLAGIVPIDPADLAMIPDGAPFPSTSIFLKPPPSATPLVLFPVRLETRFHSGQLWLRIFPDDIHVNSFEAELTGDEQAARAVFLQRAQAAQDAARAAFGDLARQFGAARAAWIAGDNVPAAAKASQWTRAPFANSLPERWIVLGYTVAGGPSQLLAVGPPIPETLNVGPTPGATNDDGAAWITDFDRAVQVGMAFRIDLLPSVPGFARIVVIGLKSSLNAVDSAARIADLLQAHHYTAGLELLALNTPTNNTENVTSGLPGSDPNFEKLFALEQGPALVPARPTGDGDRLARALNVAPQVFAHIRGADGQQDEQAQAMNTALWPATWGYYLNHIVAGAIPNPDAVVQQARDHFGAAVRARGHYPAMRVGRQPYGILPVCWSSAWKPLEGRALDAPLGALLANLRTTWLNAARNVPRVPGAVDPEAALVSLLGTTASSNNYGLRRVVGPEYNFAFWKFAQPELKQVWWATLTQSAVKDAGPYAQAVGNSRLSGLTYGTQRSQLTDIVVAPAPLDGQQAPSYIRQLADMGWQALQNAAPPAGMTPTPLLYQLLRHAALRAYLDTAVEVLTANGVAQPQDRVEAELVGFPGSDRPTAWDVLGRTLPGGQTVGAFLDGAKKDASLPAFAGFWSALDQLTLMTATDLDAAAREVLDLASYRLDAWVTSLAQFRLEQTRAAEPSGGIVLGGYGWLEDVRPAPQATPSAGFVHAPSLNQAVTAAILRSGYLANQGGVQRPLEIDLSSRRVRLALHLLDGMRQGQSLGALLGYRFERSLHDSKADSYISKIRALYPLEPGSGKDEVVDGLTLLRSYKTDARFWQVSGTSGLSQGLGAAIDDITSALDAVADVAVAESVHQMANGNLLRAGAVLDALARGDTPPPEIDVVKTPRSGTSLIYRLMTAAIAVDAPGWAVTARAQAEPRLNAWAAWLLGNPAKVRIRARYVDTQGQALQQTEIGLDQLNLAPMDLLSDPGTDGVAGELAERICLTVWRSRPANVPADAAVEIATDRDPAWDSQVTGIAEWLDLLRAVTRLATGARPLEPRDIAGPEDTPGVVDDSELTTRASRAETQLRATLTALQSAGANDDTLLSAAAFGVNGAIPSLDSSKWPDQIAAAGAELASRLQRLAGDGSARLKIIFGDGFIVLPVFAAAVSQSWPALWTNSLTLQAGDPMASIRWLQRVAQVKPGARRLGSAVMLAEALAGTPLLHMDVAQLPASATGQWVALPLGDTPQASGLSMTVVTPPAAAQPAGAPVAGLMIDEWVEVWPSHQQTTGVALHYCDPTSRPPQAILLAVRPDDFPDWTLQSLEGSVLEALDLARIRSVDPDTLGALGQHLPALYFAFNSGAPRPEAVSMDLALSMRTV
jgi:hypothetical protein